MWINDPTTNTKSVSLTLLTVVSVVTLVANGLQMFGYVSNTASLMEMMYSAVALYFGRRVTFNNKTVSTSKVEEEQKDS